MAATRVPSTRREMWVALLVTSLTSFLTPFMLSATNVALPAIGAEFGMDTIALGWIQMSYLLSSAVVQVPIGRIADIRGRKAVFLLGTVIYTISCIAVPFSTSGLMLIALRLGQGFGGAMVFSTAVAIIMSVFPAGETGKALGINVATVYIGLSLGPPLGGVLTSNFGWRSIFYLSAAAGALVFIMTVASLKGEWAEARGKKFDTAGSILYGVALAAVLVGALALSGNMKGFPLGTPAQVAILIAGGALFFAFALWELKSPSPVLDVRLFRNNRVFTLSNIAALISYSATYAATFFLSLFLQTVRGFPPEVTGFILLAQPVVQAAISPVAGWLSDRASPRIVASLGIGIDSVGFILLSTTTVETDVLFIMLNLLIIGAGIALFASPNTNAIMTSVQRQHYGTASALVSTMRMLGQVLSMTIAMIIISALAVPAQPGDSFVSAMQAAFIVFGVLCAVATVASAARGTTKKAVPP
jgi:EmrB/QacA subfamily drug resistance transporter